jgi:alkylation response protein AidB-like acyl-CoA dehydrogenase
MDFQLNEEQKSLVALVKDFAKREISPEYAKGIYKRDPMDRIPKEVMEKAFAVGLVQIPVPERYGGGGMGVGSLLTQIIIIECMEQHFYGLGSAIWFNWKLCGDLAIFGTREQQDEFFPLIMSDPCFQLGEQITEPDHGCDPRLPYDEPGSGMKTFAYRDGDEYVINGEKGITDSSITNLSFVYVRTDKNKPLSQSTSLILVPDNAPGYSVQNVYESDLPDLLRPMCDTLFDNCRVPARYLLGEENRAMNILTGRYPFWLGFAAASLGAAQSVYELTKDYAKTRIQGGKPIFKHLTVGTRIVDMLSHIEQLRYLLYKTAWEYDQAGSALVNPLGFNLCIAAAHDLGARIAQHAAEVFASRAAIADLPIAAYIRAAMGTLHGFETADFNRVRAMHFI